MGVYLSLNSATMFLDRAAAGQPELLSSSESVIWEFCWNAKITMKNIF